MFKRYENDNILISKATRWVNVFNLLFYCQTSTLQILSFSNVHVRSSQWPKCLLLANAVLGVLQAKARIKGQLDPGTFCDCHQPPHYNCIPGISVGEVRTLNNSIPNDTEDLFVLRLVHSYRTERGRKKKRFIKTILKLHNSPEWRKNTL